MTPEIWAVIDLFRGRPPADVVHVALHGQYDGQGDQEGIVLLAKSPAGGATAQFLTPAELENGELDHGPFVFLNACQVGTDERVLGDYGGFASTLLRIGAVGVVVPLWNVKDDVRRVRPPVLRRRPQCPGAGGGGRGGAGAPGDVHRGGRPGGDRRPPRDPRRLPGLRTPTPATDPIELGEGHGRRAATRRHPRHRRGVITTPGLTGEVEVHALGTPGMRGEEQATEDFRQALDDAGMAEQLSVVVSRHQEVTPGEGTRGSGGGDDIVVNVPAPGEGNGQVLLYAAEDGSLSWHLADDVPRDRARPGR